MYIYIYIYISNDAARQSATGLNLLFCVFLWRVCLRACLFVCWFVSFFVCLFRLCVFFKLLATLGLHFHTPLRPLCTFGLHLGSFLRSLGTLGPSFGVLFSTLGAQGQLCGLFWHTRGPKVEITKKEAVLDSTKYFFGEPFGSFFINIEGVCGRLFACRVLVAF